MIFIILWIGLCFVVALSGQNKTVGYWGVFFLSLILSPLIGLIIGLVSAPKVKPTMMVQSWKCTKCGQSFTGMPTACGNCGQPMAYPLQAYDNIKYTCNGCSKFFFGRKEECPHCSKKMAY